MVGGRRSPRKSRARPRAKALRSTSKRGPEKQVFWAPTPLTVKSWADVDDEDDDDYYATTAPPQAVWGGSTDPPATQPRRAMPWLRFSHTEGTAAFKLSVVMVNSYEVYAKVLESESEEEGLDEIDDDNGEEHDHEPEVTEEKEPIVKKIAEVSLASKDPERQLSKKELKKKELAELDAVLAELGYPKSESGGQDDSRGAEEKKLENDNGEVEKESATVESKSAKKKKKKDKSFKETKEQLDQRPYGADATNGTDEATGTEKVEDDASVVDVKEKIKESDFHEEEKIEQGNGCCCKSCC
ncbi:hypothetical protein Acr_11g0006130 [Actinidia rufa]|uniref:Uncharacterized protein n=1 Tax=Actinidia rufa TaxID=165716 RepID=A0A7J0FEG4_9ERIC|nr:hypothetical protein Acr_11g0006130 [Actinidia rufa]